MRFSSLYAFIVSVPRVLHIPYAYKILVGKPEGKGSLRRSRLGWEDNIKKDLVEIEWAGVAWTHVAHDIESGELLWTRWWTFGFRKRRGISWLAEWPSVSEGGWGQFRQEAGRFRRKLGLVQITVCPLVCRCSELYIWPDERIKWWPVPHNGLYGYTKLQHRYCYGPCTPYRAGSYPPNKYPSSCSYLGLKSALLLFPTER